jgi:hypothetical protein
MPLTAEEAINLIYEGVEISFFNAPLVLLAEHVFRTLAEVMQISLCRGSSFIGSLKKAGFGVCNSQSPIAQMTSAKIRYRGVGNKKLFVHNPFGSLLLSAK